MLSNGKSALLGKCSSYRGINYLESVTGALARKVGKCELQTFLTVLGNRSDTSSAFTYALQSYR